MESEKNQNEEIQTNEGLNIKPQRAEQTGEAVLSNETMRLIAKTAKYMRIMFVFYCITAAIIVLQALVAFVMRTMYYEIMSITGISIVGLVISLGLAFLMLLLGSDLKNAAKGYSNFRKKPHDVDPLEYAIQMQAGYWKMITVITCIGFGLVLLFMLIFVLGGISGRLG
ncbi:MAG: hypothetical protein LBN98_04375 [Prevotellaceae bacterium]|jgi:hypothetical protein|nr:hypothetical protein [Prevotellaceae bacterium]